MTSENSAHLVTNAETLGRAILRLQDESQRSEMQEGARRVIAAQRGVLDKTWTAIRDTLA